MLKVTETAKKRTALGQGLDALIPLDNSAGQSAPEAGIKHLPIYLSLSESLSAQTFLSPRNPWPT